MTAIKYTPHPEVLAKVLRFFVATTSSKAWYASMEACGAGEDFCRTLLRGIGCATSAMVLVGVVVGILGVHSRTKVLWRNRLQSFTEVFWRSLHPGMLLRLSNKGIWVRVWPDCPGRPLLPRCPLVGQGFLGCRHNDCAPAALPSIGWEPGGARQAKRKEDEAPFSTLVQEEALPKPKKKKKTAKKRR